MTKRINKRYMKDMLNNRGSLKIDYKKILKIMDKKDVFLSTMALHICVSSN